MTSVPFLRPNLVRLSRFARYIRDIDETRQYSNFGPLSARLEARILDQYFDGHGAVTTVANGMMGLVLAIQGSKRPLGRYAIMPSFTFAATPLAAMWCGLEPYFVDITENDWTMDERLVSELVSDLKNEVGIIVPYACFGTTMNLDFYIHLHESGVPVVVDAAASFGSQTNAHQFGTNFPGLVMFSFHATKPFGVGEGGMVYSADSDAITAIRQASNFGFSPDRLCELQGMNAKLSEYAAAIGLATLDVFDRKIAKRQKIYGYYLEFFERFDLRAKGWSHQTLKGSVPSQFFSILCPEDADRQKIAADLTRLGIETRSYFSPACHEQAQFGSARRTDLPATESVANRILNLPLWEELRKRDVAYVMEGLSQQ